jgi:class 3 adenylate cyclase
VAELVISAGGDALLRSHRGEITVVFCDLRGFTAFAESAEPEEVMAVLAEYHATAGEAIFQFGGTLERFAGDGLMVFFNDPMPCPDHASCAVAMAAVMRERVGGLARAWRRRGYDLGFSAGIAMGYATLGTIGFEGRLDYGAIGTVTNRASRLCDEAHDGQIVIGRPELAAVEDLIEVESLGSFTLKGFLRPTPAFNVIGVRDSDRWGSLRPHLKEVLSNGERAVQEEA